MSFRPGDEAILRKVLIDATAYDDNDRHNVILDLIGLMREHPHAEWQVHAEWVFEHSPCSACRRSAFDWMAESGVVPKSILKEAFFDAESDTREAAREFRSVGSHVATEA